jgi:serine/threonine protein kinase
VYRAAYKKTDFDMAVKMVPFVPEKTQEEVKKEINVLRKCRHPNIVSYYGCAIKDNYLWVR